MESEESIGSLVRRLETEYITGQTLSSKYVETSLYDDVSKIYAYLESKHTSGEVDALEREKPFFNIVLAARNIWFRATDLDRKNIRVKATKSEDVINQYVATALLQDWMRRENFGQFLNDWGINSSGFNECVIKFVEKGGRLVPSVVPWVRIICDSINFKDNPKIEILELTEAQLRNNPDYDQKMVEGLCESLSTRKTVERSQKDNKTGYVRIYEVHGEFSQAVYNSAKGIKTTKEDEDIYFQQMHVVSFVANEKGDTYDDYTLYCGKEKDPYMLTALLPEVDGSIALRGAVKNLFEAQWMINHTVKAIKDQLDLASKLIYQTSDGNFVGQNALSSIENGDILIHQPNQSLTQVQNNAHDITSLQNFGQQWKTIANEINGISEAMTGANPPSGTAWRQTQALLTESHSLFEIMTENKGLAVEQMLRQFVIPFIKKKLKNSKEIATTLEAHGIQKIDTMYLKQSAIKAMLNEDINSILNGQPPKQDLNGATQQAQQSQQAQGSQRFLKPSDISDTTWNDILKDMEWDLECDITGEDAPDKDDLTTLTTVLQTISANPRVLYDPNAKLIFNKILSVAGGMSPLELADAQPFIVPPTKRFTETLDYKDAPEDIKRQMEEQQGFQPSQQQPPQPTASAPNAGSSAVIGGLPVKK